MTGKIAVIGDGKSVSCFRALGFDTFDIGGSDAGSTLFQVASAGYAIIYMTEQAAATAQEMIERYEHEPFPAIIRIPSNVGSNGDGMKMIDKNVEKAIGRELFE